MFLSKAISVLHSVRAACSRSPIEVTLAEHFEQASVARIAPTHAAPLVVVAPISDVAYYAMLGEIISGLRIRRALRVDQICTQALRHGAARSLRHFMRARINFNSLTRIKWEGLYGIFCDHVGYRSNGRVSPLCAVRYWLQAWRIWRSLGSKEELAELSRKGVLIGDLIIDTYLRLRPTTSIMLKDFYLLVVIRQALKDLDTAFAYFQRARPAALLTIYTVYIQLGIPARVALACGVKVLSFGNLQEFCTPITIEHRTHTKDSSRYSIDFDAMVDRPSKRAQAARALEARLSGCIDPATAYMKKSAYAVTTTEIPDVAGATVVFLHDFYDSLHIYSWVLFHDFWEWACFTIETLQAAGRHFWIKSHPNQKTDSSAEIEALRRKYPDAKFLPPEITNRQLMEGGMACAVTVYGSVAPEMAFLGVPSISCGDSPHASFNAFHLARGRQDYAALLSNSHRLGIEHEKLKAQACAFYYMHNMNLDADGTLLRNRFSDVWSHVFNLPTGDCFDKTKTISVLAALTDNVAFQRFSDTLLSHTPS